MEDGDVQPLNLSEFRKAKNASSELQLSDISNLRTDQYSDYLSSAVRSAHAERIVPQLGQIADRFGWELDMVDLNDEKTINEENNIGKPTADLLWRLAHTQPPVKIDKETLEKFYSYTQDPHILKRMYALSYFPILISLDNNNGTNSLHLESRFIKDLSREILAHDVTTNDEHAALLLEVQEYMPHKLGDFLVRSLELAQNDEQILKLFVAFSNVTSYNEMRRAMLNYSQGNVAFQSILKRTEKITGLTLNDEIEIHSDNNTFYKKMNKKDYVSYNELTEPEVDFLEEQTTTDEEILDVGSGTGRILVPLSKRNRKVSGIDVSEVDVKSVNDEHPDLTNELGSWHSINLEAESKDVIYSLARSPLHNSTPQEWLSMLREFNRVLRKTSLNGITKGRVYLDLPDNESNHYKENMQNLAEKLRKIGIKRILRGTMIDSPDQKNFIDRMSPNPDQLIAMAALTGFDARKIASKEYHDDEGNIVTNNYWQLIKTDRVLTDEEENDALNVIFQYADNETISKGIRKVA